VTDYERVLIPTDGSRAAGAAVDHGVAVAAATDATVHALNVVDLGALASRSGSGPPTALYEQFVERGEEATERIAERAREAGLDAVTEVREGFPGATLLEYAREADASFVAMGTHGRTGVERVVLGSTTERTIRRAEMPVLSVHPGETDAE
jgi:nucleotide-binding universal stress UspA family protein